MKSLCWAAVTELSVSETVLAGMVFVLAYSSRSLRFWSICWSVILSLRGDFFDIIPACEVPRPGPFFGRPVPARRQCPDVGLAVFLEVLLAEHGDVIIILFHEFLVIVAVAYLQEGDKRGKREQTDRRCQICVQVFARIVMLCHGASVLSR